MASNLEKIKRSVTEKSMNQRKMRAASGTAREFSKTATPIGRTTATPREFSKTATPISGKPTASVTKRNSGMVGNSAVNKTIARKPTINRGTATTPGFKGGTDKKMKTKMY